MDWTMKRKAYGQNKCLGQSQTDGLTFRELTQLSYLLEGED